MKKAEAIIGWNPKEKEQGLARNSITHPLRIDCLSIGNGQIGLTFCPGKKGDSVFGEAWDRDLNIDIEVIRAWGANAVLSLIEDHEFKSLSVPGLGRAVEASGMEWYHFPIRDVSVPTPESMDQWHNLSPRLHEVVDKGGRLLIHCRGGLGRAGTVAALMLVERGHSAPEAIEMVRSARHGAIETPEQERFVAKHALAIIQAGFLM